MTKKHFAKLEFSNKAVKALYLSFTDKGICELSFKKISKTQVFNDTHPIAMKAKKQLDEYLAGKLEMRMERTLFQL